MDRFHTLLKTRTGTCLRRLQDSVKMSKRDESRKDEAIFLCFVSGCVVSACWAETARVKCLQHTFNLTQCVTANLIDLIGQLGQNGDPNDAMFNTVL